MLENIVQSLLNLHFQYTEQFLVALLPMALTVVIHGQGIGLTARYFKRFGRRRAVSSRTGPHVIVLITIVAIMLAAHFIEVFAWAFFYLATDMLSNFRAAMLYSVNSYTTLGASNIELPGRWSGLGGLEAMTGMLMFGWSTAVLAVIVQESHGIEA